MEYTITGKPEYSMIHAELKQDESIIAESGALVSCSTGIEIRTSSGGLFSGVKRKVLGGESFFMNTFTAKNTAGSLNLAPSIPGDIVHRSMDGEDFFLQSGAFVASSPNIDIDTSFQGLKGFFSGEGLFMLKASGHGDLFFCSFGAIEEIDVATFNGNYIVDTGYVVAFESTLRYEIKTVGGLKSTFFSGEGLVCSFTGEGRLFIQTRAAKPFASWVHPFRPVDDE